MVERRDEDFLSRWSRRKRKAARHDADDIQQEAGPDPAEAEPAPEAEDEEAEANRQAAEAIDIDALKKGDDFSLFLKRGVPAVLRNKALRKLWRTNPVLANLDGLNDYDTDFNNPAHNAYTSLWQAGRGYLSRSGQEEEAREVSGDVSDAPEAEPAEPAAEAADDAPAPASDEEEREAPPQPDLQDMDEEEEERQPRRVSIRRRLEG